MKEEGRLSATLRSLVQAAALVTSPQAFWLKGPWFEARIDDPLRQWKLPAMDLPYRERWYDYSRAGDQMLEATDTDWALWYIIRSDNTKRAQAQLPYPFPQPVSLGTSSP